MMASVVRYYIKIKQKNSSLRPKAKDALKTTKHNLHQIKIKDQICPRKSPRNKIFSSNLFMCYKVQLNEICNIYEDESTSQQIT